jgi:kinesin family protein 4/21/27
MIEIYNEECKDLLHIDIPSKDIFIREDKDGRIFFTGAREETVIDVKSAFYFLEQGNLNRRTGETMLNQSSSRSHAIFTISFDIIEYNVNRNIICDMIFAL